MRQRKKDQVKCCPSSRQQLHRIFALLLVLLVHFAFASVSGSRERLRNDGIGDDSGGGSSDTSPWQQLDNAKAIDDSAVVSPLVYHYEHLQPESSSSHGILETVVLADENIDAASDELDDEEFIGVDRHPFLLDLSVFHRRRSRLSKVSNVTKENDLNVNIKRRLKRDDVTNDPCFKFQQGDPVKREFYSPNYPNPYPKNVSCYKVLEAQPNYVLKVEFRDNFDLEDHEKCHYDYLEIRDGKYGYSRPIGNYCRAFPFPEITSSSRYLWLHFHSDSSIQGSGFRAVWDEIPRPQVKTPEAEECQLNVTNMMEYEIKTTEIEDRKKTATDLGTELDCIWNITVPDGWKIQITFPKFDLEKPNECDINYVQVYDKEPNKKNHPSLISNFCGSIADLVTSKGNETYLRFFVTKAAMKSSFEAIMTAIREKGKDKECREDEFDCQDACIAAELKCNKRPNCRYRFDEDTDICNTEKTGLDMGSEHIIIVLVVFCSIMTGLCCTCCISCIRKLMRDQKIIKEHIRQSRERKLDELGRKTTPSSGAVSGDKFTEANGTESVHNHHHHLHHQLSESPSLELLTHPQELVSAGVNHGRECSVQLSVDLSDIHQSNNVSNATQERLQESSEDHETREMACQTRESIFDSGVILKPTVNAGLSSFSSYQSPTMSRKHSVEYHPSHHYHHHAHPHVHPQPFTYHHHHHHMHRQVSEDSSPWSQSQLKQLHKQSTSSAEQSPKRCSACHPTDEPDGPTWLCLRHSNTPIVPAPPGWSAHESMYNADDLASLKYLGTPENQQQQQPPSRGVSLESHRSTSGSTRPSPKFMIRQRTVGSGENYGFIYGPDDEHTGSSGSSSQRSGTLKPVKCPQIGDGKFKTEAVIEVEQKRPFSIESTKSAPDVIATH